jgi:hypothetical protein
MDRIAYLVYEVRQQTFNLIDIYPRPVIRMCANPQRCCELGNRNTSSANGRLALLGFFEPSSNKNLSE